MKDSHAIFRVYSLANTVEECFWEVFSFWVNYSFKDFIYVCLCVYLDLTARKSAACAAFSLVLCCVCFSEVHKSRFPQHNARFTRSVREIPSSSDGESGLHQQLCRPAFLLHSHISNPSCPFLRSQSYRQYRDSVSWDLKTMRASVCIIELVEDDFGGF